MNKKLISFKRKNSFISAFSAVQMNNSQWMSANKFFQKLRNIRMRHFCLSFHEIDMSMFLYTSASLSMNRGNTMAFTASGCSSYIGIRKKADWDLPRFVRSFLMRSIERYEWGLPKRRDIRQGNDGNQCESWQKFGIQNVRGRINFRSLMAVVCSDSKDGFWCSFM